MEKFDAEADDVERIVSTAQNPSLFAGKKLIIVERFFSAQTGPIAKKKFSSAFEKLEEKLPAFQKSQDTIILFWDAEINTEAKKEVKKFLDLVAKFEEFPLLAGEGLKRTIVAEARKRGISLTAHDFEVLTERYSSNLWGIAGELDKAEVSGTLEVALRLPVEDKIYKLTDAIVDGKKEALFFFRALCEAGVDELYILGALRNGIRGLLLVSEAVETKQPLATVEKFLQAHPYVFKKMQTQVRTHSFEELKGVYRNILLAEHEIKGGGLSSHDALGLFVERAVRVPR